MGGMSPVAHPLNPPTLAGNEITVDLMLKQPTRVTRMIMDLSLQRFVADRVFGSPGGVTGGAVVYDQATKNEIYTDRDAQRVAPGAEFPLVTSERQAPKVAEVEKWGGKVFITDEARDRNDAALFTNQVRQLTNTIVRKTNQRTIEELDGSILDTGQTFVGNDWSAVVTAGVSASSAEEYPARDFAVAQQMADEQELGVVYDLLILNPADKARLMIIYGTNWEAIARSYGYEVYATNRQPAGSGKFVAQGQVGEMRLEKVLSTESWREEKTERNWVQASVRPVMYVTNPYAVLEVTGLAG